MGFAVHPLFFHAKQRLKKSLTVTLFEVADHFYLFFTKLSTACEPIIVSVSMAVGRVLWHAIALFKQDIITHGFSL